MIETKEEPCMVCKEAVTVAVDIPEDEPVLCWQHFFTEDVSEDWEEGDGSIEEE